MMSKETPKDDPRQKNDQGPHSQTNEPWKGNPEKEQRSGTKKSDPDKWQESNAHTAAKKFKGVRREKA
jgi:hypothetical protein